MEAIYQSGSSDCVLLNKLSIIDEAEMETLESGLLLMLYENIFIESAPLTALNFGHIQQWNRHWLGNVYDWAGLLRSVNLVKEGFKFAAADGTPHLLAGFEKRHLHAGARSGFKRHKRQSGLRA